jgi:demethylmenaquinone methyltransferase/2-methoxy-6-polyprenyl-1,4-benzoquinol methylase
MFGRVAPRYDLLNGVLSLQLHHYWRRRVVRMLRLPPDARVLDHLHGHGRLGNRTRAHAGTRGRGRRARLLRADAAHGARQGASPRTEPYSVATRGRATAYRFAPDQFDAATMAFGLRNLIDKPAAFREIYRVLKRGGMVAILELTRPQRAPMRWLYDLYALQILPRIGKRLSHADDAYLYLPMSIQHYEDRATIAEYMQQAGFTQVCYRDLTFGVVCVHIGVKP